jgi:hypothetical protein
MSIGNHTIAHSAEMGALPTLLAAAGDESAGSYIGPDGFRQMRGHPKVVQSTKASHDREVAARLWELSEEMTGVTFPLVAVPA